MTTVQASDVAVLTAHPCPSDVLSDSRPFLTLDEATAYVSALPVGTVVSSPDGRELERFTPSQSGYRMPWRPVEAGVGRPASDGMVAGWLLARSVQEREAVEG